MNSFDALREIMKDIRDDGLNLIAFAIKQHVDLIEVDVAKIKIEQAQDKLDAERFKFVLQLGMPAKTINTGFWIYANIPTMKDRIFSSPIAAIDAAKKEGA